MSKIELGCPFCCSSLTKVIPYKDAIDNAKGFQVRCCSCGAAGPYALSKHNAVVLWGRLKGVGVYRFGA